MEKIYLANVLTSGAKEYRAKLIDMAEKEEVFSLESYFKTGPVSKLLDQHPKLKVFLDSGAHSLINQNTTVNCVTTPDDVKGETVHLTLDHFLKLPNNEQLLMSAMKTAGSVGHELSEVGAMRTGVLRRFIDFSFNESPEVKKYFEDYIAFVKKYEKQLYGYVNLDVIFNPEKSWDNQKYMESCGLKPIPVFHFGEDISWLRKYMDNYEYIGIGGLGQDITKDQFISTFGDEVFTYIIQSKQKIRTHGFAVTSFDLLKRYPWATVDSTTWIKIAAYGKIFLPGKNPANGEFDVNFQPIVVYVSKEGLMRSTSSGPHYTIKYNKDEQHEIEDYLKQNGIDIAKAAESLYERTVATIHYFRLLQSDKFVSDMQHLVCQRRRLF